MDEIAERFLNAIAQMQSVADAATPEEAAAGFDEATLQSFWREWTGLSQWAGSLWRLLNQELGDAATPAGSGGPDIGGSG